jgi:glyoxylase-like metal-dependent hydrolase (beta-lactamase superfamily II)
VVFVPRRNVVHCGDLLFYRNHPFLDANRRVVQGWMAAAKSIAELCDEKTLVVPATAS